MATRFIVQAVLQRTSFLPEDSCVNTWHFEGDDGPVGVDHREQWDTHRGDLHVRMQAFYTEMHSRLSGQLAPQVTYKYYDWSDAKPRVPRFEETVGLSAMVTSALPGEVALCLSMEAEKVSGENQARRRGRIYLGPLNENILAGWTEQATQSDIRPSSVHVGLILDAAEALATPAGAGHARLAVFSPTTLAGGGSADDSWNDVATIWIDNAFDTQRRRGSRATSRTTRTL